MNYSKSAFKRYKVIDSLLRNTMRKYPSMNDIIQACIEKLDFEPSIETIQKDLANMKLPSPDGFDAPIKYCRLNKGYLYTDPNYSITGQTLLQDELDSIREAVEYIRMIGGSRISENFAHAAEKLLSATIEGDQNRINHLPALQVMAPPISRGFENFDLFLRASNHEIPVSFLLFSYDTRRYEHILFHPFLIKEFENRWYLVGYSENHENIQAYGFDRIKEPYLLKKHFQKLDYSTRQKYVLEMYGVHPINGLKTERIVIRVSRRVTHDFLAYPLHDSQIIEKKGSGRSMISFNVVPSIELARYFLSLGKEIVVQEPHWFKEFTKTLTV
jgi:predicted DNA-binding transcriptional regulator YafY